MITRAVEQNGRFVVAGAVSTAPAALDFLRQNRVHGIVLDIEMPGITGLAALPDLLAAGQGARILIVSSSCGDGAAATIEALALGAADTLVKPDIGDFAGRFSNAIAEKLTRLLAVDPPLRVKPAPAAAALVGSFDIVAIGASTGGIHALSLLLRELPAGFTSPILITQHLPDSFMPYFAAQMAVLASRPCEIAEDRLRIRPGRMIVAPGNANLRVVSTGDGAAIRLTTERARSGCLPSVDPMFESLAEVYGARALAVVLSGMGRDGTDGARLVAERGGSVIVQDQASSVIWGMPGSIAGSEIPHAVMDPSAIGKLIATRRRPV